MVGGLRQSQVMTKLCYVLADEWLASNQRQEINRREYKMYNRVHGIEYKSKIELKGNLKMDRF